MEQALVDAAPVPFRIPTGMTLIPINRKTGKIAQEGAPDTILEAFKPGTGPLATTTVIGAAETIQDSGGGNPNGKRKGFFRRLFNR